MDKPNELPTNGDQANRTLAGQNAVSAAETDLSDSIFSLYVGRADEYDKALVEGWKDDMDSLLIFVRAELRHSWHIGILKFSVGWAFFCNRNCVYY